MLAIGRGRAEARGTELWSARCADGLFIDKTDDHNRVDYALRLDAGVRAAGEGAVLPVLARV